MSGSEPEQRRQSGPDHRVVVGEHHAYRRPRRSSGPPPAGTRPDLTAGGRRTGRETTAQLGGPLVHRLSDPTPGDQVPAAGPSSLTDTSSRSPQRSRITAPVRPGVPGDVGQGLGGDPVRRRPRPRRAAPAPSAGTSSRTRTAAPSARQAELLGPLPQGADQAELVQRGRPQVVDDPADVGEGRAGVAPQGGQQFGRPGGIVPTRLAAASAVKAIPVRVGPEPVVQFAAEPAAFLLLGVTISRSRDDCSSVGDHRGVHRDGQRCGEQLEHPAVRARPAARSPSRRPTDERADRPGRRRSAATGRERSGRSPSLGEHGRRRVSRATYGSRSAWSDRPGDDRPDPVVRGVASWAPSSGRRLAPDWPGRRTSPGRRAAAAGAAPGAATSTSSTVASADRPS